MVIGGMAGDVMASLSMTFLTADSVADVLAMAKAGRQRKRKSSGEEARGALDQYNDMKNR